jgi:hypothetical protein
MKTQKGYNQKTFTLTTLLCLIANDRNPTRKSGVEIQNEKKS